MNIPNNFTRNQCFVFKASKDDNGVQLFEATNDFLDGCVYINNELTDQHVNNLSFKQDDIVAIVHDRFVGIKNFFMNDNAYHVYTPLPRLDGDTMGIGAFDGCCELLSIPSDLFVNNTHLKEVYDCFDLCVSLTEIPEGLFDCLPLLESIRFCFYDCTGITYIPKDLFKNNPRLKNVYKAFSGSGINHIPRDLFRNNLCNNLINDYNSCDFDECFKGCHVNHKVQYLPKGYDQYNLFCY